MYAVGDDMELKFHHLCGVVRFHLSASSAVSVSRIAVATDRNINGTATVSGSGSSVTLSTLSGTATTTLSLGTAQGIASAKDFYMYLPTGSYSSFVITMMAEGGASCIKTVDSAIVIERGKITTITLTGLAFGGGLLQGALSGVFSVASGRTVHFSQGNLQYQASTGTWRFATNQYDCIGSQSQQGGIMNGNVTGSDNANISSSYSGWIDLFGWGTSGWDNGNTYYQPYSSADYDASNSGQDYGPRGSYNLTGSYANADWGVYNAISNGGNIAGLWRTLTNEEWVYLLGSRTGCSTVGGILNGRFALAQVNGVGGVIVFPDSYTHPSGVAAPQNVNDKLYSGPWSNNSYSIFDWTAMQTAGAVFLPAAGYRDGTSVSNVGSYGHYWSSSYFYSNGACGVLFGSGGLSTEDIINRYRGFSVRLVRG